MNKFVKSLTMLLHAVIFTAVLSSLTATNNSGTLNSSQESNNVFYPSETLLTIDF